MRGLKRMGALTSDTVLENIPCPPRRALECFRQRPPIRWRVPLATADTRPGLSSPYQQLLYNAKLTAYTRLARESKCAG